MTFLKFSDANFKLTDLSFFLHFSYAHCMIESVSLNSKYGLNIPSVCPSSADTNSAFCEEHCKALREKGFVVTGLREDIIE